MYVEKRVSRCRFLVNKLVYGIILLKFYVRGTITQILGNLRRMRTITHAIGTRPFLRLSVQLEKKRPGNEATFLSALKGDNKERKKRPSDWYARCMLIMMCNIVTITIQWLCPPTPSSVIAGPRLVGSRFSVLRRAL